MNKKTGQKSDNEKAPTKSDDKKWWHELEEQLSSRWDFRYNSITGSPEFKEKEPGSSWEPVTDFALNSIVRRLQTDANNPKATVSRVAARINSDFAPSVNPVEEYFQGLRDAAGAIDGFCSGLRLANETQRDLFRRLFRKWVIASVANVFERDRCANHTCLVFTGGQGIGKSTAIRAMVPPELWPYYFEGHWNPENKDSLIALAVYFLINLDDSLAGITSKAINELKAGLTINTVTVRRPYDRYPVKMDRIASFTACSNEQTFLHDSTGNRRFLPFELSSIDMDAIKSIPLSAMWGEAYHAYKAGEVYWIGGEDQSELTEHNSNFEVQTPEFDLLTDYFQKPEMGGYPLHLTADEIITKLQQGGKTSSKLSIKKMGEALKKAGFERVKKRIHGNSVYRWEVVELPEKKKHDPEAPESFQQDAHEKDDCPF